MRDKSYTNNYSVYEINMFYYCINFLHNISVCQDEEKRIDERLINCVLHITIPARDPKFNNYGTGFLVGVRNVDSSLKKLYMVTNKHMVGSWSLADPFIPYDSIIVDFYSRLKNKPIIQRTIRLINVIGSLSKKVALHPNPRVDVALVDLTELYKEGSKTNINWDIADSGLLLRTEYMQQQKISYGDQVFAIGYPSNVMIAGSNLPIAKSSYIASSTSGNFSVEFPLISRHGDTVLASPSGRFYLVDGLIIGGNSGGPVLSTNQTFMTFTQDRRNVVRKRRYSSIIGIVSMILNGTGIAVIYSADNILELINIAGAQNP